MLIHLVNQYVFDKCTDAGQLIRESYIQMHNKSRRLISAIAVGCAIEVFWIISLILYKPDPPLNPVDVIFLLSQMPGGFVLWLIAGTTGGSVSMAGICGALFIFQSPFYVILTLWVLKLRDRE